jgi:hypothetical protein
MRFFKRFHLVFFLSLALGLFCGELSESIRLADDVSNDLVEVLPAAISTCAETGLWDVNSRQGISVLKESARSHSIIPFAARAILPAQDLLRLFSIQLK